MTTNFKNSLNEQITRYGLNTVGIIVTEIYYTIYRSKLKHEIQDKEVDKS